MLRVTDEGLRALRDKYAEILRLREAQPGEAEGPRTSMMALAARFPGALRELDALPMDAVLERLQGLGAALTGVGEVPAWAAPQLAYHGWMRTCLRAKRLRAAGLSAPQIALRLRSDDDGEPGSPAGEALTPALVEELLAPPSGRLNPWVFTRVARDLQIPERDVHEALFPR